MHQFYSLKHCVAILFFQLQIMSQFLTILTVLESSKNLLQGCWLPQSYNSCLCFLSPEEYCNVTAAKFECFN